MKIILSKSQWETIGNEAGWITTTAKSSESSQPFSREYEEIDGAGFDQPGKSYDIKIFGDLRIIDDSDYSYPSGYGRYVYVEHVDVNGFEIKEYDETGAETVSEDTVKSINPELYNRLLDAAEEWVKNDWKN